MEILSTSTQDTKRLAQKLAATVEPKTVLLLNGNLGAGKTTFVQYFVESLGSDSRVQSPTFVILKRYQGGKKGIGAGIKTINHLDLYRITNQADLENLDLPEILNDETGITLIEWPKVFEESVELMESIQGLKKLTLNFEYIDETTRKIHVQN